MFKLQISSIFNFDRAHQSWISGILGVKYDLFSLISLQKFFGQMYFFVKFFMLNGYSFFQIFQALRLFFLPNLPGPMLILCPNVYYGL